MSEPKFKKNDQVRITDGPEMMVGLVTTVKDVIVDSFQVDPEYPGAINGGISYVAYRLACDNTENGDEPFWPEDMIEAA